MPEGRKGRIAKYVGIIGTSLILPLTQAVRRELEKNRDQEQQRADSHLIATATDRMARYTRVLVIATIFSVGAAGFTAWILRNQLEEMKDEQRPWVRISMVPDATRGTGDFGGVPISITLSNVGKTPAFDVRPELWGYVIGEGHNDPAGDQMIRCEAVKKEPLSNAAIGTALFPGDVVPWTMQGGNFNAGWDPGTVRKYSRVRDGKRVINLYLHGCVDYFFADHKLHHQTGFMFRIGYLMPRDGLPDAFSFDIPIDVPIPANQLKLFADATASSVPIN